jgi:hypothetical protein
LEREVKIFDCCDCWLVAGSIRRERSQVRDIEIVALPLIREFELPAQQGQMFDADAPPETVEVNLLLDRIDALQIAGRISRESPLPDYLARSHPRKAWGRKFRQFTYDGWPVDLFLADQDNYGVISVIRTGSAEFSAAVAKRLKEGRRWRFGGGYLRPWYPDGLTDQQIATLDKVPCPSEEALFERAGMRWIEPKDREVN